MKICKSCGNNAADSAKFCDVCGSKLDVAFDEQNKKSSSQTKVDDIVNKFTNTADTTADFAADDINKNKSMAVLAYLGLLFLVPLFAAKESPFARYHTNQGMLLFIAEFVGVIATAVPFVGWIAGALISVFTTALFIIGIINAMKGEAKELFFIGKFRVIC